MLANSVTDVRRRRLADGSRPGTEQALNLSGLQSFPGKGGEIPGSAGKIKSSRSALRFLQQDSQAGLLRGTLV